MTALDATDLYRIALGGGKRPDDWQRALTVDAWPRVLIAPTGSGKTAAVTLGWAAHRLRAPERTPRRLVWCLPMRTLVEQTVQAVKQWFDKLHSDAAVDARALPHPDDVYVLMGGANGAGWIEQPERPVVMVGTQDMLLSRALMRGYASSRAIWPMEFALLHEDAQWVFDEVQLMGAGRATSVQLEAFRRREAERASEDGRPVGMSARSLWISATLDPAWLAAVDHPTPSSADVVRVDPATTADDRLARLAHARKTLRRSDLAPATAKASDLKHYEDRLAAAILAAHCPGQMTLVIVNRVRRAQELHATIRKLLERRKDAAPVLALVHSRFRAADRTREMDKIVGPAAGDEKDVIAIATQAVEAGVDISAAVMFVELAPWPSMVQRFGRANRYAEVSDGAQVHWIDLLGEQAQGETANDKDAAELALPYTVEELRDARERLATLTDAAPAHLPAPGWVEPPRRVIRRKDLDDLFDTDPDLTGFDVDVSLYVRDARDTDVRVFWRDLSESDDEPPRPRAEELCAVPIGAGREWLRSVRKNRKGVFAFVRDPQWRRIDGRTGAAPPGWRPFGNDGEEPWPGLTLLVDVSAGGYDAFSGFTGDLNDVPGPVPAVASSGSAGASHRPISSEEDEAEGHDEDPQSEIGAPVTLSAHLRHVTQEAEELCRRLGVAPPTRQVVVRAARWHDVGKAHDIFQETMRRGLDHYEVAQDELLAKTVRTNLRHCRPFRHELASALAFLSHEAWSRDADLVAYLIAAHHGKVRMNLRALPRERAPAGERAGARFARGVWEGDELRPIDLEGGERWEGGQLVLSLMEMGWDEVTKESWTERTRDLLARLGPFRLAWLEALVMTADRRASAEERKSGGGRP